MVSMPVYIHRRVGSRGGLAGPRGELRLRWWVRADHDELVFRLRMLPVWKDCGRPVDAIYKEEYDRKMSVLDLSTLSIFKEIDKRLLTLPFRLRQVGRKQKMDRSMLINQPCMHMPRERDLSTIER
jgi:hypothetical protein